MTRFKSFVSLTLMGGLLVILPVSVFIMLYSWLMDTVADLFAPITAPLLERVTIPPLLADLLVILALLACSFVIGLLLQTTVGRWLHDRLEAVMFRLAPGYRSIREIIHQLIGDTNQSVLRGDVVMARIYGPDTAASVIGIVTSRHPDGMVSVYVPTAPLPSSGFVYHLPEDCVEVLDGVTVEQAMRTVIACGAGSSDLIHGRSAPTSPDHEDASGASAAAEPVDAPESERGATP